MRRTWASLHACVCDACASPCQSWCAADPSGEIPSACQECLVDAGLNGSSAAPACGDEVAICNSDI
jgi:hypothetical protein